MCVIGSRVSGVIMWPTAQAVGWGHSPHRWSPGRGDIRPRIARRAKSQDLMPPLTGLKPLLVDGRSPTAAAVGQMTSPAARASSDAQILILTPVGGGYRR